MTLAYKSKLGFKVNHTNIKAQKIEDSTFNTFEMIFASFQIEDKLKKVRVFQKIFLFTNFNMEVVLEMLF